MANYKPFTLVGDPDASMVENIDKMFEELYRGFNVVSPTARKVVIGITVDGGGAAITTGQKGYISSPVSGTIVSARLLADQSGSVVIDVWKDRFANGLPTVADTITSGAKPTLSSQTTAEDVVLSGWTKTVTEGDVFGFNVDSASTVQRVTLALTISVST